MSHDGFFLFDEIVVGFLDGLALGFDGEFESEAFHDVFFFLLVFGDVGSEEFVISLFVIHGRMSKLLVPVFNIFTYYICYF